jgi:hypothetical protein
MKAKVVQIPSEGVEVLCAILNKYLHPKRLKIMPKLTGVEAVEMSEVFSVYLKDALERVSVTVALKIIEL